jgi:hypothetical protein
MRGETARGALIPVGIVFFVLGLGPGSNAFFVLGLVFLIVGFQDQRTNRDGRDEDDAGV